MKPKLLITGSDGFIARSIKKRALNQYDIINFYRPMSVSSLSIYPDYVIHCGAELYNEPEMFESNIALTYELLQYALKTGCKKFIYLGTSSEYGRVARGTTEIDRINPTTMYEATKGCGTLLVQAFSLQYGLPGIIVRPYTIYGPYENSKKLIPTIYRSYKYQTPLKFVQNPCHDWTYIDEFVSGIEVLLNNPYISGDIVNFGTGLQMSNIDVLNTMEEIIGSKIPFIEVESVRSYDTQFWYCDNSYAKSKYKIEFKTDLRSGLEKYYQWMQKYYS